MTLKSGFLQTFYSLFDNFSVRYRIKLICCFDLGIYYIQSSLLNTLVLTLANIRDRPRLFDQVGHQTTNVSIGYKFFFSQNNVILRLAKIMNKVDKNDFEF